jgi:hypothetical protein
VALDLRLNGGSEAPEEDAMKRLILVLLGVLILLTGTVVPSDAWGHGVGWWAPGLFFGGLALGTALAYPYYTYPYPYPPYAYSYSAPLYVQAPVQPPLVQRDACYAEGCYHLYGDGVTQPWQWVWTPAAPPPPSR